MESPSPSQSPKSVIDDAEANLFLRLLAELIDSASPSLRTGARHLEFTPKTLTCLNARLADVANQSASSPKSGFFGGLVQSIKGSPRGLKMLRAIQGGTGLTSHVVVKGAKKEQSLSPTEEKEWSSLDFSLFHALTKLDIVGVQLTSLRSVKQVCEVNFLDCKIHPRSRVCERLQTVRTMRVHNCALPWESLRYVARTLRVLHLRGPRYGCPTTILDLPVFTANETSGLWVLMNDFEVTYSGLTALGPSTAHLTNISTVNLSHNQLKDITVLKECRHLRTVTLTHNQFSSLVEMCACIPHVVDLDVANNPITNMEGLEQCRKLATINIENCNVQTFWPCDEILEELPCLASIKLRGNPLFEKVRPADVSHLSRAVFASGHRDASKRVTVDGVLFGPLPIQVVTSLRQRYRRLWDPVFHHEDEEVPLEPAAPSPHRQLPVLNMKEVMSTPTTEQQPVIPPPASAVHFDDPNSALKMIEKDKALYGDDWLRVQSHTGASYGAHGVDRLPYERSGSPGRKMVKKIVKKVIKVPVGSPAGSPKNIFSDQGRVVLGWVSPQGTGASHTTTLSLPIPDHAPYPMLPPRIAQVPLSTPLVIPPKDTPPMLPPRLGSFTDPNSPTSPVKRLGGQRYQEQLLSVVPFPEQVRSVSPRAVTPRGVSPRVSPTRLPTMRTTPSSVDKSGRAILIAHISTTWRELSEAEVEGRSWVGIRNVCASIPHTPFRTGRKNMRCRMYPLIPGPVWAESDVALKALEVWVYDPETDSIPLMVNRFKGKYLLKLVECTTVNPSVRYISLKQRKVQTWEVDPMQPEGTPSAFDDTVLTCVYEHVTHHHNNNEEDTATSAVTLRNVIGMQNDDSPASIRDNTRSYSKAADFDPSHNGEIDGNVHMTPSNADAIATSVRYVNKTRTLCGFVAFGADNATALVGFLKTRMRLLIDECLQEPRKKSFLDESSWNQVPAELPIESVKPMTLAAMRLGSFPIVKSDEVIMHLKSSVFGHVADPRVMKAWNVSYDWPAIDGKLRDGKAQEALEHISYINFLFSTDKETDERGGVLVVSNHCLYFCLDYNMTYPALGLGAPYLVPFMCHPRAELSGVHVGHNLQYLRLTFGGSDPQTYLLLTRDVSVSVGILDCIRAVVAAERIPIEILHHEAPTLGPSPVVGYFCMFFELPPPKAFLDLFGDEVKGGDFLDKLADILAPKKAASDFPQHIYPLRHVNKDMVPVTLAITPSHIHLLQETYAAWPSNDRNATTRWQRTIGCYDVADLLQVEMVSERGANINAHAMVLSFAGDDGLENWTLVSQHGTNNSAIYRALSVVWLDKMRIQLPRTEMKPAVRSAMFDAIDVGRREAAVQAMTTPFRKAFGSK